MNRRTKNYLKQENGMICELCLHKAVTKTQLTVRRKEEKEEVSMGGNELRGWEKSEGD